MGHFFRNMLPSSQYTSCSCVGSSDCTRHFSNPCDICMVAKVVQGNQSDNHCNQSLSQIHGCPYYFWEYLGAGIAQWLERRTRDWKVAGSNPCWNGGRIFFSRVDFLCWLLFRYPFHPRVTTVARKKSRSFCQKCRWQVTAKYAYTLRMWLLLNCASALVTTCP